MAKKGSILLNLLKLDPKKINNVLSCFEDIDQLLSAGRDKLEAIPFLFKADVEEFLNLRNSGAFEKELELIEKEKIDCLDIFDKDYPVLLKEISNPPLVLYTKGNRHLLNEFLFAIVGSRSATAYGVSIACDFSKRLACIGVVIVSGLARGIDAAAHAAALNSGQTIAVLGSGLLNIYPWENKKLAEDISKKGLLVSEFPLLEKPLRENFPRRNRIVSGLSRGVLVVEAAPRSGALITARLGCEQNREVFAVPGNINSLLSGGTNSLIKDGAKLTDCLEDILEELNFTCTPGVQVPVCK